MNIPADYKSEIDFFNSLNKNQKPSNTYHEFDIRNLAFIILDNPKIPWTWYKQKLMQFIWYYMMGGVTGGNPVHKLYFATDIIKGFKKAKDDGYTHAMMCQIGMILNVYCDQIKYFSPIENFYKFSKTDDFAKAHIIAKPNKSAFLHPQHIELNLNLWDGTDFVNLGLEYKRADDNFHDDYTPSWIKVDKYPIIKNFNNNERYVKWFLYPNKKYDLNEKTFYNFLNSNDYVGQIPKLTQHLRNTALSQASQKYFCKNTEHLAIKTNRKFDIIITPTAGISLEHAYKNYSRSNTKLIVYDYDQTFLDIKKKILNYGMSISESMQYLKIYYEQHTTGYRKNNAEAFSHNDKIYTDNMITELRDKIIDHGVEYVLSDFMFDDFDWIDFEGKSVFINISNIFYYHICWTKYDYKIIYDQYLKLIKKLKTNTKEYVIFGKMLDDRDIL